MAQKIAELVKEYREARPLYEKFTQRAEELVKHLVAEAGLSVHSVRSRPKEIERLEKKLSREDRRYKQLSEITDLAGVRIICLFSDQVDEIAEIIRDNFDVNDELSVDKRETLDPDRFGYLSLHYVVKLSKERGCLPEYQKYCDLVCEIQVRSILQHAWAEIEHDLGYKSSIEIPRNNRRAFSRLASLLEMADEEFVRVRNEIDEYSVAVRETLRASPQDVLIDKVSLTSYMRSSPTVSDLDNRISELTGEPLDEEIHADYVEYDLKEISYFDFETFDELDKALTQKREEILEFVRQWVGFYPSSGEGLPTGISIFYLCYLLVGASLKVDDVVDYLEEVGIGVQEEHIGMAEAVVGIMENLMKGTNNNRPKDEPEETKEE